MCCISKRRLAPIVFKPTFNQRNGMFVLNLDVEHMVWGVTKLCSNQRKLNAYHYDKFEWIKERPDFNVWQFVGRGS